MSKWIEYQNHEKYVHLLYCSYIFQVLNIHLLKTCKIEPPDILLFVVFISFYVSRYHFSQFFRTSLNVISKKDFRHNFSFLMDSFSNLPTPLNGQNLLSMTEVFC